jgi:uncharacterized membrane protein YdbT with pleckstrin-like domain
MKNIKKSFLSRIRPDKDHNLNYIYPVFLLPDEDIIFQTHPHWLFILLPEIGLALAGVVILYYLPSLFPQTVPFFWFDIIFRLLEFSLAFAMIIFFLYWLGIKYYLTSWRLIEERGIVGKRIVQIGLDRAQDLTCRYGVLGRLLGFGDLEIESAGTEGKIIFGFIPTPWRYKEKISAAIRKIQS